MELFKRIGFTFNARHRIWVCALGAVLGMMVLSQCSDSDDPTLIGPVGSTHSDVNYHYSDDGVTDISFDVDNDKLAISSKHHFENPAVIFPSASGELTVRVNVSGTDYGTAQTSDFNSWAPTSANTRGSDCGIPPTDQLYFAVGGTITVKSTLGTFNYDVAMGEGHGDGECLHTWWFGGAALAALGLLKVTLNSSPRTIFSSLRPPRRPTRSTHGMFTPATVLKVTLSPSRRPTRVGLRA